MLADIHHISYFFEVIADYCSHVGRKTVALRFWPATWRGLRNNVHCLSYAHWKARGGLPIRVNWTLFARCYGRGAMNEHWLKLSVFEGVGGSIWAKISGAKGRPPLIISARYQSKAHIRLSDVSKHSLRAAVIGSCPPRIWYSSVSSTMSTIAWP